MEMQDYVDEVLLKLGQGRVSIEISDDGLIERVIQSAFREIQRYINVTKYATLQYSPCIDLSKCGVLAVTEVMRTKQTSASYDLPDAIYLSLTTYPGSLNSMSDYRSYLRTRQIRNTLNPDLSFRYDETTSRLYVAAQYPTPTNITIAYIPKLTGVEQIVTPYWQDMLIRLALALAKETLGRIRGKYVLNNSTFGLDAETLLSEAQSELKDIRDHLQANADMVLPID